MNTPKRYQIGENIYEVHENEACFLQNPNDENATMMFEDFLDMMSVLSENAPANV